MLFHLSGKDLLCNNGGVALAFEEMHTPYASEREIREQKLRNAHQRKKNRKTNGALQKYTYHQLHKTIPRNKMFYATAALPFNGARIPS